MFANLKDRRCENYCVRLLSKKMCLWDIPEKMRNSSEYARKIYITGFRADRMVSKERYIEDLMKMRIEIILLENKKNTPISLLKCLRTVHKEMENNLELFDRYKIEDFH